MKKLFSLLISLILASFIFAETTITKTPNYILEKESVCSVSQNAILATNEVVYSAINDRQCLFWLVNNSNYDIIYSANYNKKTSKSKKDIRLCRDVDRCIFNG